MRGFIFDLDGTLLDSIGLWLDIDKRYMAMHGIKYKREYSDEIKKLTFLECAYYFRDVLGVNKEIEEIQKDWQDMSHHAYMNTLKLKPFSLEFVQKCAKNGKCIIATSCQYECAHVALQRLGILPYIEEIVTTLDVGANKENPKIYLACAERIGCSVEECVVFEDVLSAAKCAKNAGFKVVGVYDEVWEPDQKELIKICDRRILSFKELLDCDKIDVEDFV